MGLGTFSEVMTVPAWQVARVRPDTPLDRVSPVGCAVLSGWGAVQAVAGAGRGCRVAVWGCGAVGLSALMAARQAGAETIIGGPELYTVVWYKS